MVENKLLIEAVRNSLKNAALIALGLTIFAVLLILPGLLLGVIGPAGVLLVRLMLIVYFWVLAMLVMHNYEKLKGELLGEQPSKVVFLGEQPSQAMKNWLKRLEQFKK